MAHPQNHRLDMVKQLLARGRCTHILVSDPIDGRYISGFSSSNLYLLITRGRQRLCSDFRYQQAALTFCRKRPPWEFALIKQSDFSFLAGMVPPGSRLGVQANRLTVEEFDRLSKVLPRVRLVKLGDEVSDVSISKSASEVASIRKAARIADAALSSLLRRLKPGITELEAAALLERACGDLGSEKPAFDTIALFGARSALVHGRPSHVKLKRGDWLLFDFGCTINGLCSDMTRTLVLGPASPRHRLVYGTALQAQTSARTGIRAGMKAAHADKLARSVIETAGYGRYFGHSTGHGVGYRIHEPPRLGATNKSLLREGAIVTIEPGIYIPGFGGVRIEDMVCLSSKGARVLTQFPRELIELPVR